MATILPSILTDNSEELKRRIQLVGEFVGLFHIDVMDGRYVPSHSLSLKDIARGLDEVDNIHDIELHLMIDHPEDAVGDIASIQHVRRVVLHPDSTDNINRAITLYKQKGIEVGLSYLLGEEVVLPVVPFDYFLVLAEAKPGYSGTPFDSRGIEQIRWIKENLPMYPIEIDGGMNEEHAQLALEAGATELIVNSYIFKAEDPVQALKQLQQL